MANLRVVPEMVPRHQGTFLVSKASAIFYRSFCRPTIGAPKEAACPLVRLSRCDAGRRSAAGVVLSPVQLKEDWLRSMSFPSIEKGEKSGDCEGIEDSGSCPSDGCVIGIDPDASGALAILRGDTAEVFDAPHLKVMVGKTFRKRLNASSIVQLIQSFGAPRGTIAYIEQSTPYPQDGKQGWWSGGFTYGLWIGILVASGFSVVPVQSRVWKDHFQLSGRPASKDGSREAAIALFPSLDSQLRRKKDHGRAEALLIAAYGKVLSQKK